MPSWYFPENLKIRAWCFPKVFTVELCHVIAIFQVTSNLLPRHVAHLCFSIVCVFWSFTTSVANHYLLCSFRVRSLEDLSPEHWELGGVLGVAVVTAWQGVGLLERAEEVKRTTTSLPGKNLSFHAQEYCPLQIAITKTWPDNMIRGKNVKHSTN